jgi:lipopolysaccharide export system protein LptA
MEFVQTNGPSVLESLRAENGARWTFISSAAGKPGETLSSGKLTASLIDMDYSAADGSLEKVEAARDVVMEDLPSREKEKQAATRILTDKALFHFRPGENLPSDMFADGHVRIEQRDRDGPPSGGLRTWSDHLKAVFAVEDERMVLSSASQWGNFRYEDAASSAHSGRCDYEAARGTIRLTEKPEIHFEMGSATGGIVEFDRNRNLLLVQGNVRSVLSGAGKTGFIGASSKDADSLILSDRMEYFIDSESASYSGNVSLLSEDQQLQADTLEIASGGARVTAGGRVLHRVSGNRVAGSGPVPGEAISPNAEMKERGAGNGPISIISKSLEYEKAAGTILYSGEVTLRRGDLLLKSGTLEAVLDKAANAILAATAKEDVVVHKENWECKGDEARYFTDPERFVITGSPVELRDPAGVRSFPHRLTYNIADGRIQLERDHN